MAARQRRSATLRMAARQLRSVTLRLAATHRPIGILRLSVTLHICCADGTLNQILWYIIAMYAY